MTAWKDFFKINLLKMLSVVHAIKKLYFLVDIDS